MDSRRFLPFYCIVLILSVSHCGSQPAPADRQPAVAGQFYPGTAAELHSTLRQLFVRAHPPRTDGNVVAIIAPHAGYIFSGEVAASAFNQIEAGRTFDNIFVLGVSHYVAFDGASIDVRDHWITPLGKVTVNRELGQRLIREHSCFSSRRDAHEREHSVEVQLPFLQHRLGKGIRIVPIVIGTDSPAMCRTIAEALRPYLTANNLFVVSTDFSHYPSAGDASVVDSITARAICSGSPDRLLTVLRDNAARGVPGLATSMCGWAGVLTLLCMTAATPAPFFDLVHYRNSGESGDPGRAVGYWAIAVREAGKRGEGFHLSAPEQRQLLAAARAAVVRAVSGAGTNVLSIDSASARLRTPCGAFVTLRKHGELRGCIGRFEATEALYRVVDQMAVAAATQDYRFPPVDRGELDDLAIEISVLTPMRPIRSIDEIEMGKHGITIRKGSRVGTFLPQVATETGWTKEEFLGHCAQDKAGIGWNGWKDAEIFVYEAYVFAEE
jgi:AmmeMemoRadiSam system protein B/AmmeMemoRadiSam system protein A